MFSKDSFTVRFGDDDIVFENEEQRPTERLFYSKWNGIVLSVLLKDCKLYCGFAYISNENPYMSYCDIVTFAGFDYEEVKSGMQAYFQSCIYGFEKKLIEAGEPRNELKVFDKYLKAAKDSGRHDEE